MHGIKNAFHSNYKNEENKNNNSQNYIQKNSIFQQIQTDVSFNKAHIFYKDLNFEYLFIE